MKAFLLSLCLFFLSDSSPSECASREVFLMGTSCDLTVLSPDRAKSLERLEQFIRVLESAEKELSTWKKESVLTALNRQPIGKPFMAEPGLCRLLSELQHWTRETGGAFDPGIGALIDIWGIRGAGRFPTNSEITEALTRSGMHLYNIESSRCRIARTADVIIDCGAFGKGAALERIRSLDPSNEFSWLVNLGGQVAVKGIPSGTDGWNVDIAHPLYRHKPALSIRMTSGSLATSGGSERDLTASGKKISHILDPRSGNPVHLAGSVSVWHESALIADILSTALYVMGPEDGISWAEARGIAACYLLDVQTDIKFKVTRDFRERFMSNQN